MGKIRNCPEKKHRTKKRVYPGTAMTPETRGAGGRGPTAAPWHFFPAEARVVGLAGQKRLS